jgi:hypothetical protein
MASYVLNPALIIRYTCEVGTYLGHGTKKYWNASILVIMDIISSYSNRHKLQNIKAKLCKINNTGWVSNLFDDRNEPNGISYVLLKF